MAIDGHPVVKTRTRRVLAVLTGLVLIAVIVGMTLLATGGHRQLELSPPRPRVAATVVSVRYEACPESAPSDRVVCASGTLRLPSGQRAPITEVPVSMAPDVAPGDHVLVTAAPGGGYDLVAFRDRGPILLGAAIAAVVALLIAGGLRGLRAAAALAFAGAVTIGFAVPVVLNGRSATAVAGVSAVAIAAALIAVLHGIDARARIAFLASSAALAGAVGAGNVLRKGAHLAGLPNAVPSYLHVLHGRLPTDGLLLGGMVIGATGAIVDLAVRQVDATWDLRDAPASWWGVTIAGMRRGQAAMGGMATALVLAYIGAALPTIVLFTSGGDGASRTVRGETIAVELARAALGTIALAVVIPLTAAVAAFVVVREARNKDAGDPRRFRTRRERRMWQEQEGEA